MQVDRAHEGNRAHLERLEILAQSLLEAIPGLEVPIHKGRPSRLRWLTQGFEGYFTPWGCPSRVVDLQVISVPATPMIAVLSLHTTVNGEVARWSYLLAPDGTATPRLVLQLRRAMAWLGGSRLMTHQGAMCHALIWSARFAPCSLTIEHKATDGITGDLAFSCLQAPELTLEVCADRAFIYHAGDLCWDGPVSSALLVLSGLAQRRAA